MYRLSRQQTRKRIIGILVAFKQYCKENGMTFYLCAGTLLGAIRHQGFIPWDDDVDICMGRPFYDNLLKLTSADPIFGGHFKVISFENRTGHYPYIKILDTDTITDQKYMDEGDENSLWIDVFPFDGVNENINARRKTFKKTVFCRKIIMLGLAKPFEAKTLFKKFLKPLGWTIARAYGIKRANQNIIEACNKISYGKAKLLGDVAWGDYDKEIMRKEDFEKSTVVTFEGIQFLTMSCWKQYLIGTYGNNFMQLPPVDQRVTHNVIAFLK